MLARWRRISSSVCCLISSLERHEVAARRLTNGRAEFRPELGGDSQIGAVRPTHARVKRWWLADVGAEDPEQLSDQLNEGPVYL